MFTRHRSSQARSTARMVARMQLLQPCTGDVGIDLGGREVAVAQQHLHGAQIGAVVEQMRGERMAQRMRRYRRTDTGYRGVQLDAVPERLAGHLRATLAGKYDIARLVAQQQAPGLTQVALEPVQGLLAQ